MTTKCKTIIGHKANKGTCPNKAIKNEEYCTLHIWQKPKSKEYNTIMKALNTIDEFASETVQDNDNGEAQKLEKAYIKVANFISKYAKK